MSVGLTCYVITSKSEIENLGPQGITFLSSLRRRISQLALILLLIAQVGVVVHRLEHYLAPSIVDCDENACAAFAPAADPPSISAAISPPERIIQFIRFWTAHPAYFERPTDRLGFRAQAPPLLRPVFPRAVV